MVKRRSDAAALVVELNGEVDIARVSRIQAKLLEALEKAPSKGLVVDLRKVSFVDAAGVGVFVATKNKARRLGVSVRFVLPDGGARRVFDLTGTARTLEGLSA